MIEEKLIQKAKTGDNQAIDEIMATYRFLVKVISRKYFLMGGEKEDLMQEGMIGLYKAILNYNETKGSFKNFARLCIEGQIQLAIRNANRKKHQFLNKSISIEKADYHGLLPTENPQEELIEKEGEEDRFRKIKEILSPLENKVLDYYLEGLGYGEIASNLKITTKSVDNAISRIKIKLKAKK